jgi:hypothetical protein
MSRCTLCELHQGVRSVLIPTVAWPKLQTARPENIIGLVVREGMQLTQIGILAGLGGAAALTHMIASLLFGVSTRDVATFLAVPVFTSRGYIRRHGHSGLPAAQSATIYGTAMLRAFPRNHWQRGSGKTRGGSGFPVPTVGILAFGIAVAGRLVREDVRYTIAGLANNLPTRAYGLLREAVEALTPMAKKLMAAMAVCAPEGFRLALAAEVAELDEPSSLDALQEIHSRSLAEELDVPRAAIGFTP